MGTLLNSRYDWLVMFDSNLNPEQRADQREVRCDRAEDEAAQVHLTLMTSAPDGLARARVTGTDSELVNWRPCPFM